MTWSDKFVRGKGVNHGAGHIEANASNSDQSTKVLRYLRIYAGYIDCLDTHRYNENRLTYDIMLPDSSSILKALTKIVSSAEKRTKQLGAHCQEPVLYQRRGSQAASTELIFLDIALFLQALGDITSKKGSKVKDIEGDAQALTNVDCILVYLHGAGVPENSGIIASEELCFTIAELDAITSTADSTVALLDKKMLRSDKQDYITLFMCSADHVSGGVSVVLDRVFVLDKLSTLISKKEKYLQQVDAKKRYLRGKITDLQKRSTEIKKKIWDNRWS